MSFSWKENLPEELKEKVFHSPVGLKLYLKNSSDLVCVLMQLIHNNE